MDEIGEDERAQIAALVREQRMRSFNTKAAAYRSAGVNSATWSRVEEGQPVRMDRLRLVVRALWPASGGDWQAVIASDERARSALEEDPSADEDEDVVNLNARINAITDAQIRRAQERDRARLERLAKTGRDKMLADAEDAELLMELLRRDRIRHSPVRAIRDREHNRVEADAVLDEVLQSYSSATEKRPLPERTVADDGPVPDPTQHAGVSGTVPLPTPSQSDLDLAADDRRPGSTPVRDARDEQDKIYPDDDGPEGGA